MSTDFIRKQIILALHKNKMTIPKVADACGINKSTLYNYVHGVSELTSSNLSKVMDVLHITISS